MLIATLLAATMLTYSSERCGYSFDYPSTWQVVENPKAKVRDPRDYEKLADCAVGLRPRKWREELREAGFDLSPYPVRVTKWNKGFVKAARESFFMQDDDGAWTIHSRGVDNPAEEFRTACCQGLIGSSWARIWSKTDEVGTLAWQGAIVNDHKGHSAIVVNDHDGRFTPVVIQIVHSLRFHSRKTPK